jgi:hypothetical protein
LTLAAISRFNPIGGSNGVHMRLAIAISVATLLAGAAALPAMAQGAAASLPFDTDVTALKPGEWVFDPRVAPAGPMLMLVNIRTQRANVYRNGVRIGTSTVSTGRPGKKTPTGVFQILQKRAKHTSSIYKTPMPYMQRLTWDGIALHAGRLPGYPASAGCVRLPYNFAQALFAETPMGMTVAIIDQDVAPEQVSDASVLAPATPKGKPDPTTERRLAGGETWRWQPEKSAEGPVTIVLSTNSRKLIVYRGGVEIGRTRIGVPDGFDLGTRAAQFAGRDANGDARWIYIGLPGYETRRGQHVEQDALAAIIIPPAFRAKLRDITGDGTTLLATDAAIGAGSTGRGQTILDTEGK